MGGRLVLELVVHVHVVDGELEVATLLLAVRALWRELVAAVHMVHRRLHLSKLKVIK